MKTIRGISYLQFASPLKTNKDTFSEILWPYSSELTNLKVPTDEIDKKKNWPLTAKSLHSETFSWERMAMLNVLETSSQYSVLHDETYLQLMQTNFQWNLHLSSKPMVSQNYKNLLDWKLYKLYLTLYFH